MPALRTVEDQIARMRAAAQPLPAERILTAEAAGRVLAEPVIARFAVPPFTNSAMDGYALRVGDLDDLADDALELPVAGDAPAGAAPATLPPGAAMRIMTGAPLPHGADTVVPVERTDQRPGPGELPDRVRFAERPPVGRNIREAGEDVDAGAAVLDAGRRLDAAAIGAAISVGAGEVLVRRRPRVAVVATGDELDAPGTALAPGRIPDSNSPMLAGMLRELGCEAVRLPATSDSVDEFLAALESGAADADLIVTTGGVSAGAFEVVRQALEPRGVEFAGLAMQPGKPQGFGSIELGGRRVLVACLPGNPVSVFVSTHVLVRPLLDRLLDAAPSESATPVRALAAHEWRPPRGRRQYAPAVLAQRADGMLSVALPHTLGAKSHLIASLHQANSLAIVPAEVETVRAGDALEVLSLAPLR